MAVLKRHGLSIKQRLQLCSLGLVTVGLTGGWLLQAGALRLQGSQIDQVRLVAPALDAVQQISTGAVPLEGDQAQLLQAIVDQSSAPGQMLVVSGPNRTVILPSSDALLRFDPSLNRQHFTPLPWLQPERFDGQAFLQGYQHQLLAVQPSGWSIHLIAKTTPPPGADSWLLWLSLASGLVAVLAVIDASVRSFDRLALLMGRLDPDAVSAKNPAFLDDKAFPLELHGVITAVNRTLEKFVMLHAMVPSRLQPVASRVTASTNRGQQDVVVMPEAPASSRSVVAARRAKGMHKPSRAA